jgi:hypothetical protein
MSLVVSIKLRDRAHSAADLINLQLHHLSLLISHDLDWHRLSRRCPCSDCGQSVQVPDRGSFDGQNDIVLANSGIISAASDHDTRYQQAPWRIEAKVRRSFRRDGLAQQADLAG